MTLIEKNIQLHVRLLVSIIIFSALDIISAQTTSPDTINLSWQNFIGTPDRAGTAYDISLDEAGNSFVTGSIADSTNVRDVVTVKYSTDGTELWKTYYSGINIQEGKAITLDKNGNVYVGGYTLSQGNYIDYLTIKYNSSGVEQWYTTYNGTGNYRDEIWDIVVDDSGNVYVTGESYSEEGEDITTIKYNNNGNEVWVNRFDSTRDGRPIGLILRENDGIYVIGSGLEYETSYDCFLIKYSFDGQELWHVNYANDDQDTPFGFTEDKDGNILIFCKGDVQLWGYFITLKYDTDGHLLWDSIFDPPYWAEAYDIITDGEGNVYCTGSTIDASISRTIVVKYNSSGEEIWNTELALGEKFYNRAKYIDIRENGNLILAGTSVYDSVNVDDVDWSLIEVNPENGSLISVSTFDGPANKDDEVFGMTLDQQYNIFVIGYMIFNEGQQKNIFATAKYSPMPVTMEDELLYPITFYLSPNYPNPFNPSTRIQYSVNSTQNVTLKVYDLLGREVATLVNEEKPAGEYEIEFNGQNLPSGIYFYQLIAGKFIQTRKMILVK